jgi:Flp pilus assembly protein TadD
MRGLALGQRDRHPEAEEALRTFLELAPNHREAQNVRNLLARGLQLRKK